MEESEAHEAAMEAWRLANPEEAAKQDAESAMWDKKWAEIYAQADMVAAAPTATKPSLAPAAAHAPKPKKTKGRAQAQQQKAKEQAQAQQQEAKKAKVPRSGVVAAADGWFTVVKRR
jgi:phytoene dehydrogenase-like protein